MTRRGVASISAQGLQRGLQRPGGEAVQGAGGEDAGGGQGQFGRLFAVGLGHGAQRRGGGGDGLTQGDQGHGLQALDLGQGRLAAFQPGLGDQGLDLGRQIGALGRREGGCRGSRRRRRRTRCRS
jgi:hypothetical protein